LPHRVCSALRVSHPLGGFLLARTSDHFQVGNVPGVRSSGAFPRCPVPELVTRGWPSWRLPTPLGASCREAEALPQRKTCRLQGFTGTTEPYCPREGVLPRTADPLLSFSSPGYSPTPSRTRSHAFPLMCLPQNRTLPPETIRRAPERDRTSAYRSRARRQPLSRQASPQEVPGLPATDSKSLFPGD
jgi:hypothetical protein